MTLIYEDQIVKAELIENAAASGHVTVTPQKQVRFLQELTNEESAHFFLVASYSAAILFQGLQAEGTNIIVDEEGERLIVHIVARKTDDGLNFAWEPKQLDEGVMKEAEERIKDKAFYLQGGAAPQSIGDKPKGPPPDENPTKKDDVLRKAEDEENYLIQQLIRIP